jgi:hypothetical protein
LHARDGEVAPRTAVPHFCWFVIIVMATNGGIAWYSHIYIPYIAGKWWYIYPINGGIAHELL